MGASFVVLPHSQFDVTPWRPLFFISLTPRVRLFEPLRAPLNPNQRQRATRLIQILFRVVCPGLIIEPEVPAED